MTITNWHTNLWNGNNENYTPFYSVLRHMYEIKFLYQFFLPGFQGTESPGFQFFLKSYNSPIFRKHYFPKDSFSSVLNKCRNLVKEGQKAPQLPPSVSLDAAAHTDFTWPCQCRCLSLSRLGCILLLPPHRQLSSATTSFSSLPSCF